MPVKQVKILGSCAICGELEADHLERMVRAEAARLGVEIALETITDFAAIAAYGVLDRPGLVIDGKVVSAGRLPKPEHLEFWLSERKLSAQARGPSSESGSGLMQSGRLLL